MKFRLRLGEDDGKRYDCPDWIDLDLLSVSVREAIVLQNGADIDGVLIAYDSPAHWRKDMFGIPVLGADGQPVMQDVLDENNEPKLDSDGQPLRQEKRKVSMNAVYVGVWLALRRAGAKVTLADLDVDFDALEWEFVPDEDEASEEPGKAESDPETTS